MKKYKYIKNPEQLKEKLNRVIKEVYEEENPHVITEYRKFFTKHVGLFSRNFISAYIIKKFLGTNGYKSPTVSPNRRSYQGSDSDTRNRDNSPMTSSTEGVSPGSQKNSANDTRYKKIIIKNMNKENTTEKEFMEFITSFKDVTESNVINLKIGEQNVILQVTQQSLRPILHNLRTIKFKGVKLYISTPNRPRR